MVVQWHLTFWLDGLTSYLKAIICPLSIPKKKKRNRADLSYYCLDLHNDGENNLAMDNLSILVRPLLHHDQSAVYSQALDLLDALQSSPSCIRLATSTLLTSCQTIDDHTSAAIEPALDEIRALYAARLALCEISSAGLGIPPECTLLHVGIDSDAKKPHHNQLMGENTAQPSNSQHTVETLHIRECLQSLESRPQWWTSYSNSRQNAAIMCQAARADIERGMLKSSHQNLRIKKRTCANASHNVIIDELINLHKSLVSTISELDRAMVGTLKDVKNFLSDQKGFVFALKDFRKKLLWSLESLNTQTQSYFLELVQKMESVSKSVLTKLNIAVQDTIEDTEWHLVGLRNVSFKLLGKTELAIWRY